MLTHPHHDPLMQNCGVDPPSDSSPIQPVLTHDPPPVQDEVSRRASPAGSLVATLVPIHHHSGMKHLDACGM